MLIDTLLAKLDRVKPSGKLGSWMARCPAHEDTSASLSLRLCDDNRILVHCFAGCATVDVCAAIDVGLSDLFPLREKNGYQAERRRIDMEQAVLALRDEAYFLQATQYWVAAGRALTAEYQAKLDESSTRIDGICKALGIVQDNKAMGRLINKWLASSDEAGIVAGPVGTDSTEPANHNEDETRHD